MKTQQQLLMAEVGEDQHEGSFRKLGLLPSPGLGFERCPQVVPGAPVSQAVEEALLGALEVLGPD